VVQDADESVEKVALGGDVYTAVGWLSTIRFTGPWSRELKGIDEPISVYQAEAATN
jgi:class 3 adenylate cyclase